MKKEIIYVLIIFTGLVFSCTKDKIDKSRYWGNFKAMFNNGNWPGHVFAGINGYDTSKIDIGVEIIQRNVVRESLYFNRVPKKNNSNRVYKFTPGIPQDSCNASYTTITDEGDVVCDNYFLKDEDSLNILYIDYFDYQKKEVKGSFNYLKFYIRHPKCNKNAPDSIIFTEGSFHTKILFE